jgi:hypothetical protein
MGVRSAEQRIRKYDAKVDPEIVKMRFAQMKPNMVNYATDAFASLVAMEEAVKTILDAQGVLIGQYPFYLSFAREIWRLKNKFGGQTLFSECDIATAKWRSRGLDPTILNTIKRDVFGILPTPPAP